MAEYIKRQAARRSLQRLQVARKEEHMIHWLWALAAFILGGSLGALIMAVIIGGSRGDE